MANKKGATDTFNMVAVIAMVILVVQVTGIFNFSTLTGGADGDGSTDIVVDVRQTDKACGSTTMTVDFVKKHAESTDMTAENATIFINGARKEVTSEGSTFTAQGGDHLRVYNALDTGGATYLATHSEGDIPCTGQTAAFLTSASFMSKASGSDLLSEPNKLYEADSVASAETIINDDFTSNPGTALSLGLGETKVITVRLKPVFEEGYGVADGNTIACRMTDTRIDQSKVTIQSGGSLLGAGRYIPSSSNFAVQNVTETIKYWHLPPIDGADTSAVELLIAIKGDETIQPTTTTNFSCDVFGTDYYESDDGQVLIDVENRDDNSKIGRTSANEFSFNIALS